MRAVILWLVLIAMGGLFETGVYHPTIADEIWAFSSAAKLPQHAPPLDDSTVITLRREMCFGECPMYTVRLFGSGRVEYRGENFVCAFGAHTATADPREVRRLVEAMVAAGFFGYEYEAGLWVTDSPTVFAFLRHEGRKYCLPHYHGDQGAPRWLFFMEDEIDRVAGTARWLPTWSRTKNGGRRLVCPTVDGGVREVTVYEPIEDRLLPIIEPTIEAPQIEVPPTPYDVRL